MNRFTVAVIALFAGVHWQDYFADRRHRISPLLNSVPVALLSITAPCGRV